MRVHKLAARLPSAVATVLASTPLRVRNLLSNSAIVDGAGVEAVVSVTTHGHRIRSVYLALESIGRGTVRPARFVLYLDQEWANRKLPASIMRLQARGLSVEFSPEPYGPHTKYYPYVSGIPSHTDPLITADDDIIYPKWWLERLYGGHVRLPHAIMAYRVHKVRMTDGAIAPYVSWRPASDSDSSVLNFATGVSGVVYPPHFLGRLKEAGDGFLACCPKADDIWLHLVALRTGTEVRQLDHKPKHFRVIPLTQKLALARGNTEYNGNDTQIKKSYGDCDIDLLRQSATRFSIERK
ncbi:hypothetical protein ROP_55100 [Rhodococcus opacus B4]|uniref:Glycosyltransferase n=1 Tax=Rhodococcus opacus (strain B4) TaxID=632772 RepID=C1AWI4_RHOOB|nr:hypothetical protein ROP_55100 [Rhodococcus opacus B4]